MAIDNESQTVTATEKSVRDSIAFSLFVPGLRGPLSERPQFVGRRLGHSVYHLGGARQGVVR